MKATKIYIRFFSQNAFPIQKEGNGDNIYSTLLSIKNGTIIKTKAIEVNLVIAIPSNLLVESVTINKELIRPCKAPTIEKTIISKIDKSVNLKTGSNTTLITNAIIVGMPILDIKYPFLVRGVINKYLEIFSSVSSNITIEETKQNKIGVNKMKNKSNIP